MPEDFISGQEMITRVFKNISAGDIEQNSKIQNAWRETLLKISGNGEKLAAHCFAADFKNGILLVESDHPGWNQTLLLHKKFILTGMNRLCPGVQFDSLAFRVRGSGAVLANSEEVAKRAVEKYAKKLDDEQRRLEEMGYGKPAAEKSAAAQPGKNDGGSPNKSAAKNEGSEPLPLEVKKIFERLYNSANLNYDK